MDDVVLVQTFESFQYMKSSPPNKLLVEANRLKYLHFLVDLGLEIPSICILHDDAERLALRGVERCLIGDHIRHVDGS